MNSSFADRGHPRGNTSIKAVIFDCDGVILDSRVANAALYNTILSHFNKDPLTEEQLAYVHCRTLQESLAFLLGDHNLVQEAERFWQQLDYEPFISLLTLHSGLIECLEILCRDYRTAIATSRTRTMKQVLQTFELDRYFELVVTSLDVRNPKPHPESLHKVLAFFNLTPLEACYIGDSTVDMETSRRAGVLFIAYGDEDLEAAHHLDHFSELIPLLERLA